MRAATRSSTFSGTVRSASDTRGGFSSMAIFARSSMPAETPRYSTQTLRAMTMTKKPIAALVELK